MRSISILGTLCSVVLLTACAAQDSPGASAAKAGPASTETMAAADDDTMTGSRLKRKSTDRILKSTDNATFKNDTTIRSIGNDVGIKGN